VKLSPANYAAIALTVAGAVVLSALNWGGREISVATVGSMLVVGLTLGSIYAVSASGLVVVYTTTGVFNFAQGAMGMYWAFLYWELRFNRDWPAPIALIVVVLVIAPLGGVVLDRLVMRRLQGTALVLQLMVTVGLMLGFMGVAATQWKVDRGRNAQPFFGRTGGFELFGVNVTWHRLTTISVAILLAIFLRLLMHRTRIGVAMRAVVDSRSLASLTGANPEAVSGLAWALGSSMAAVAGILIAPESGLVVEILTLVVIDASAAAAVGRLRSVPLTFLGAMVLGVGQQFIRSFLDFPDGFSNADRALPTILLFVVVLALPQARLRARGAASAATQRVRRITPLSDAAFGGLALVAVIVSWSGGMLPFVDSWSGTGVSRGVTMMITAIIMLSLVPLTGWAGQVNFAPLAFAGFGAVMFLKLAGDTGQAWGLLAAALLTAPIGMLMALPAVRLKGLYLALASMAFARGFELLFFTQSRVIDPSAGERIASLHLLGWRLDGRGRGYLVFLTIVFALGVVGLIALKRGRYGRRWMAINDSEAAAATLGINLVETKVVVFGISAAIAGFGGALFGIQQGTINPSQFSLLLGLPIVLLLVVGGVAYPAAALFGGVNAILFIVIKERLGWSWLSALEVLGPGLMAVAMVANPRGAVTDIGRGLAPLLPWRHDARRQLRLERGKSRVDEIGDLGLTRAFTDDAVIDLDRNLGILDLVDPAAPHRVTDPSVAL